MIVIIVRLKLYNLQEEDVDLRNLQRDIQNATKGAKPLIHVFEIDSLAPDWAVDKLIGRMVNLIIQDLQLYLDSSIYDLWKSVIEERQGSMKGRGSFFEMTLSPENVKEEVLS